MVANLDVKGLRFMSTEEFRVLVAAEMGMKNHTIVPMPLISSLAALKRGGAFKMIKLLAKNKLVQHFSVPYDGYRLTSKGYYFLALKSLAKRGTLAAMGIQIGVGKESDIFTVVTPEDREVCIKLHRLGRTCFRAVKNNRDYTKPGQSVSWLYLSRLSALKEFAFMKALHAKGFPTPEPIDVNRHCVVMSLAHGYVLNSVQRLTHPAAVFARLMELIVSLAEHGLIHGDFNEFNLLIDDDENVTMIDFPQMVSTSHINAEYYFNRDVNCVRSFFKRRYGFVAEEWPRLGTDIDRTVASSSLDEELRASGWTKDYDEDLSRLMGLAEEEEAKAKARGETGDDDDDDHSVEDWSDGDGSDGVIEEEDEEGDEAEGGAVGPGEEEGRGQPPPPPEQQQQQEQEEGGAGEEEVYGLEPAANNRAYRSGIYNKNAQQETIGELAAGGGASTAAAGARTDETDQKRAERKRAEAAAAARQAELEELAELAKLAAETTLAAAKGNEPSTSSSSAAATAQAAAEPGPGATPSTTAAAADPPPLAEGAPGGLVDLSAGIALPGGGPPSARKAAGPPSVAGSVAGSVCSARALEAKDRIKQEMRKGRAPVTKVNRNEGKDREMRKTKVQMKRDVQGGFFS
jgi:RIO kinase 2